MKPTSEVGVVGFDDETDKSSTNIKKPKKSGGFQAMGLSYPVLKGILKRGYKVPTPIQRKTIPIALEGRDVVAMARTGTGKTACFLLPLFEKLKEHSGSGIRALILSPTRELAIQTLKFVKELGKFTTLRTVVILGGDPMENQFSLIHSNPDVVVATPGRFLHICVEMQLKLNSIQYVIFDEADRLFEMGFSEQLTEILQRLPESRQTLLFSATLPKVLVHFAKAGLNDPVLIRLDVESKIPDTLELGFFHCRPEEREAALLCLLKHVVKPESMTVVFVATKHHVEFLSQLLNHAGISNTYIYSDLDPSARKINAAKFQMNKVNVLIVTDVAARGIDIPQLDYVINYNFPAKPKLFVHRVGRCARAGRTGQAYSLVTTDELCYLIDLHLFLGRPVNIVNNQDKKVASTDGLFGKIPQILVEEELSELIGWSNSSDIEPLKKVCNNGYKNYIKSRPGASKDSVRRAKQTDLLKMGLHPLFVDVKAVESERLNYAAKIKNYKPQITIFEMGQSANSVGSLSMRLFRKLNKDTIDNFYRKKEDEKNNDPVSVGKRESCSLESSNANDIEETFQEVVTQRKRRKLAANIQKTNKKVHSSKIDLEHYIPYKPSDDHTEQGLAVNLKDRKGDVVLEVTGDTIDQMRSQKRVEKKWDSVKRKYVAKNNREKMVKSESGQWIPVSYKTDRYERWQEKNKIRAENEDDSDDDNGQSNSTFKPGALRIDTHWGRHNLKLQDREYKPLKINTERILKERKLKEKRRQRNGRKPYHRKKDKIKKKSSKFNKI